MSGAHMHGPWVVSAYEEAGMDGIVTVDILSGSFEDGADGVAIVPVGSFRHRLPERLANARLIAAAPELLGALEQAVDALAALRSELEPPLTQVVRGRAAIAKATGAA
jgi:hypothetical protein